LALTLEFQTGNRLPKAGESIKLGFEPAEAIQILRKDFH